MAYETWTKEETAQARNILSDPALQQKNTQYQQRAHTVLYWGLLMVLIIANLLVALVLVPVLIVLSPVYTALILFFVGAAFGLFFQLLITDLAHVQQHQRVTAGAIIPLTAVVDIFLMTAMANTAAARLNIHVDIQPFWLMVSYIIAFLLPSILSELFVKDKAPMMMK